MAADSRSRRYARLLGVQVRISLTSAMQYRAEFLLGSLIALSMLAVTVMPMVVVFGRRAMLAGWSAPEALVVVGLFALLKAILDGAVSPSLIAVVEHVRNGTLDFLLLKPADAQFLVSTARFEPWRVVDLLGSLGLLVFAFARLGRWPSPGQLATGAALLAVAVLVLYSLWVLVICVSFWSVKVDNLSYLFNSIFDFARWPISVFPVPVRLLFTFVFPLFLMTTSPAMALLGRLGPATAAGALGGGLAFAALARFAWTRALGHYTSASS